MTLAELPVELAEDGRSESPWRTRVAAAVRFLAWSGAAAVCWYVARHSAPWVWRVAAAPAALALVALVLPRAWRSQPILRALSLALGVVAVTYITSRSGGIRSPLSPLYLLIIAEGLEAFGPTGALVAATVAAALTGVDVTPTMPYARLAQQAAFAGTLILSGVIIAAAWPEARRPTLLAPRDSEDLEQRVANAEEARRILNASYEEAAAAARTARRREKDAAVAAEIVAACATNDIAQAGLKRALDALLALLGAGGAALWRMSDEGDQLSLIVSAGRVAPVISAEPIAIPANAQATSIRRVCEMRLHAASPASPEPTVKTGDEHRGDTIGGVLRDGERIIGAVALAARTSAAFSPGDRDRLKELTKTLARGLLLANQRFVLDRTARDTRAQLDLANAALACHTAEGLCGAAVEIAARIVPCDNCTVFALDTARLALVPLATRGEVIDLIDNIQFEHGAGVSAWVARERKQIAIADLAREESLRAVEVLPPRVRSFVSVPMMSATGEVLGAINVSHVQPNAFAPEDVESLAALAAELAILLPAHLR